MLTRLTQALIDLLGEGIAATLHIPFPQDDDQSIFYTDQSVSDAERLLLGGTPWPMDPQRTALGPGVRRLAESCEAKAYRKALSAHGAASVLILQLHIYNRDSMRFRHLDVDSQPDPSVWIARYAANWARQARSWL
jgi:hypothetical protein